jgi:hypothetical protein
MEEELEREFEVLTAAVMQGTNFWDITPRNQLKVSTLSCCFNARLFFGQEDGGVMLFRNVG